MALSGLPDKATVVSSVEIVKYLDADGGIATAYGFEGIGKEEAIGLLVVTTDRLREERKFEWATCPECHQPWAAHFGEADDEAEDEFEDDDD